MVKILRYSLFICLGILVGIVLINVYIHFKSKSYIYSDVDKVPTCYTAIVLGAFVSNSGQFSNFLQDRLDKSIELYQNKKVKRFLLSGDHGRTNYDEVNNMKRYLLKRDVDTCDIFLDHAGFDTYNSMVRAKEIFKVTDAVVVTQKFHLTRAVYIARAKGLNAYGVIADKQGYSSLSLLKVREVLAKLKAFYEVLIDKSPRFLGEPIPITGDSRLSYDEK